MKNVFSETSAGVKRGSKRSVRITIRLEKEKDQFLCVTQPTIWFFWSDSFLHEVKDLRRRLEAMDELLEEVRQQRGKQAF